MTQITNAKEYDLAEAKRESLQIALDELYTKVKTAENELNQLEGEIDKYYEEQRALDE